MSAAIRAAMRRIVIVNPEGGSGKTTIATNLAARCAATGRGAALMDLDPQASSSLWLSKRPKSWPPIHGIAAFERSSSVTRGWQLRVPNECDTQNYVCSAQCGMGIHELSHWQVRHDLGEGIS